MKARKSCSYLIILIISGLVFIYSQNSFTEDNFETVTNFKIKILDEAGIVIGYKDSAEKPEFGFNLKNTDKNNPVVIIFDDGREATLQFRELPPDTIDIKLNVEETTCSHIKPKACTLTVGYAALNLAFIWTKNPIHPEQLNKDLTLEDGELLIDFTQYMLPENQKFYTSKVKNIKYELKCDDYRFLTGEQTDITAPQKLEIIDWSTELMLINNETNLNENATLNGSINAIFEKIDNKTLLLSDIGQVYSKDIPYLIVGNIIGWTTRSLDKSICQVSFKAEQTIIQKLLNVANPQLQKTIPSAFIPNSDISLWNNFLANANKNNKYLDETYKIFAGLNLVEISFARITKQDNKLTREIDLQVNEVK